MFEGVAFGCWFHVAVVRAVVCVVGAVRRVAGVVSLQVWVCVVGVEELVCEADVRMCIAVGEFGGVQQLEVGVVGVGGSGRK